MSYNQTSKQLVHNWLANYQPNVMDLQAALKDLFSKYKNIKDATKREELIKNKFKNHNSKIYFTQVKAHFSLKVAYMVASDKDDQDKPTQSKADQKKSREAQIALNQHIYNLQKQFYNVFFVKDIKSNDVLFFICNPNPHRKQQILEWYAIANIKRHCLERLVERLNLESIEEALDEIASSLQWIESSTKELLGRSHLDTLNRHIPTKNGALLLRNYPRKINYSESELEGHLITWIHKKQFFDGQKVEKHDFNFVQAVNYTLSNPNKADEILKINNVISMLRKDLKEGGRIIVNINGFSYPCEEYIGALEKGEYLDYIISFNK